MVYRALYSCKSHEKSERGASSAEGDYGLAENGTRILWHGVGCREKMYLLLIFSPGSSIKGKLNLSIASRSEHACCMYMYF